MAPRSDWSSPVTRWLRRCLAFHELEQVNPRRIRIGTPHRARARLPNFVEVVRQQIDPADLTVYEGVPSATVARALIDCRDMIIESLGLETPAPIPVLVLDHQIAQKLHACTYDNPKTGQNDRAHDLVDLQILEQEEAIDMAAVAATAERLFTARAGTTSSAADLHEPQPTA